MKYMKNKEVNWMSNGCHRTVILSVMVRKNEYWTRFVEWDNLENSKTLELVNLPTKDLKD